MMVFRKLLLLFCLFLSLAAAAQIPSDLSQVKASQIPDAQLRQMVQQAASSGLSEQQLEAELLRRGLPPSELAELKLRIQQLGSPATSVDTGTTSMQTGARRITNAPRNELLPVKKKTPQLFGTELFSTNNLSFEPDLRMATPKNYVIGPDDQLILNIYGLNISQQNLRVSPDGTVNVRYAGIIQLGGLSIEGATSLLRSRLSRYYPGLANGQTKLELSLGDIRSIQVILIGAVNRPGTYTLPSLATLFNALYVSGGPAENGSFRNIELIRGNKVVAKADLYEFLINGIQRSNVRLEHNDVIRVPYANLLVTIDGQLNRPGIFEMRNDESLSDAISYAGGFRSNAFRARITGRRVANFERSVLDVPGDSLNNFKLTNGDEFYIDSIIDRYQNRVVVSGAVYKPGPYALQPAMTVKDLLDKAQGLKEDVFSEQAMLVRTRTDRTKEYVTINLRNVLNGQQPALQLRRDDSLHVASIFDLRDTAVVTINGAVRKPGAYRFEDSLSLKALIIKAQGFAENATGSTIEISRRKRDVQNIPGSSIVEIISVNTDKGLSGASADVILQPYDIVTIKEDPYYKKQISVRVSGEVMMPAVYTLQSREERLSSLINRSGGLLYTANVKGAKLRRLKKTVLDSVEIQRLFTTFEKDSSNNALQQISRDKAEVAIDLEFILKNPRSEDDITLEDGDELIIPRVNNTVSVMGEVFRPLDIMYDKYKNINDYLSNAGGVTRLASKGKTFVIYPNGSSAKTTKWLGIFRDYPRVEPGSQIFVPQKPKRQGIDVAKAGILISALTALVTGIALFTR